MLPPAIGSFRSTSRWRRTGGFHILEAGASYRDASGVEANLDILLGAWGPHNGIGCWYTRGYPVFWQRLRMNRLVGTSAVFDTALFRDDQGIALLANTECYPTGCRESLYRSISRAFDLRMPIFFAPAELAPTSISIMVRELKDPPAESEQAQGTRLVQGFERFAAQLALSPLVPTIAQVVN